MILTPIAVVTGLVVGLLRGGQLRNALDTHVIWWPLLLGGLALQTLAEQIAVPLRLSLFVIGAFFMIVALMQNVHIRGAGVSAFGLALNLFVIVANGHIPTRLEALIGANRVDSATDPADIVAIGPLGQLETESTSLAWLGDIVPVSFFDEVVSFGDLILTAGIFVIAMNVVGGQRRTTGISVDELFADHDIELQPEAAPETAEAPEVMFDTDLDLRSDTTTDIDLRHEVVSPAEPTLADAAPPESA